jgi:hypothetical protein
MEQLKSRPICETCLHVLDGATAIDGSEIKVKEGDVSICFYCGQISVFTKEFNLRKITDEEMKELKIESHPDYQKLLLMAIYIKAKVNAN